MATHQAAVEPAGPTEQWVRAASLADLPASGSIVAQVAGHTLAIVRDRPSRQPDVDHGGRIFAVDNRCPHKGGPLADGIVSGTTIVCPLHAWKMSLETGEGVSGPSVASCVETFRTRVEGEVVLLELTDNRAQCEAAPGKGLTVICRPSGGIAAMTDYSGAAEA